MLKLILLVTFILASTPTWAAITYYRTICQDPKDSRKSLPTCMKAKAKCPQGQILKTIRAACESDMIRDITWDSIVNVPWNSLFVSRTLTEAPWACTLAGVQTLQAGTHDVSTFLGQTGEIAFGCAGNQYRKTDSGCQILVEYGCE